MIGDAGVKPKALPWDTFLAEDVPARRRVEGFREIEWANIRRQLKAEHGIAVPDSEEPHWVAPGRAVLWRHETSSAWGRTKDYGWQPSSRDGLPVRNAAQIASFLRLGYRFRPPTDEVVEPDVEAKVSATPTRGTVIQERVFVCMRHRGGAKQFPTWKGYTIHCGHMKEPIEELPPEPLLAAMRQYPWFCVAHSVGFKTKRAASQHAANAKRRGRPHGPVEAMEVRT